MLGSKEKQSVDVVLREYSRAEVDSFLDEITQRITESDDYFMHSMLAINQILRQPKARDWLDDDLKTRIRDLWLKIKSTGLELKDPPILFDRDVV